MQNPAVATYEFWKYVLDTLGTWEPNLGDGAIKLHTTDVISWGRRRWSWYFDEKVRIASDGRFCFTGAFRSGGWGHDAAWRQRDEVTKGVPFLRWGSSGPSNQDDAWVVADQSRLQDGPCRRALQDWRHPRPYVLEKGMTLTMNHGAWLQLVEDESDPSGWRIDLADRPESVDIHVSPDMARENWDNAVRLREYRYTRLENEWRYNQGLRPRPAVRQTSEPHIRVGSNVLEDDAAVTHLAAFFQVDQPLHHPEASEARKESDGH